jgi:hypothetical protein
MVVGLWWKNKTMTTFLSFCHFGVNGQKKVKVSKERVLCNICLWFEWSYFLGPIRKIIINIKK